MSSVPYVPPETMKNVAATSGHSVNLSLLFAGEEISSDMRAAGTAESFNFFRFLLGRPSLSHFLLWSESAIAEYKVLRAVQDNSAVRARYFSNSRSLVRLQRTRDDRQTDFSSVNRALPVVVSE